MSLTNSFTDTISMSYSGAGRTVSSKTGSYNGSNIVGIAEVIAAGAANFEINVDFPVDAIQSLCMTAGADMTVKTNNASPGADSFTVGSAAGVFWGSDWSSPCPFTVPVTSIFVSNPGASEAKFDLRVNYNA